MTLDEAIAHAREVATEQKRRSGACVINDNECDKFSACIKCAEEHEQLAEWLEDYKRIKMLVPIEQALKNEYNKAIDDFVNGCEKQFVTMYGQRYVDMRDIVNIAEQLKAGGENDNLRR